MRKLYLLLFILSCFCITSYVGVDKLYNEGSENSSPKITHFYPNPATSYINFTFESSVDKSYTLQIYSFMGKKMNETRITDNKLTINLDDNYYRGLYIYQLKDKTGRIIESGKFQVSK